MFSSNLFQRIFRLGASRSVGRSTWEEAPSPFAGDQSIQSNLHEYEILPHSASNTPLQRVIDGTFSTGFVLDFSTLDGTDEVLF